MCDIKKINHLKRISHKFTSEIQNLDIFGKFNNNHVTNSGLTLSDLKEKIDNLSSCCSILELKEVFSENKKENCSEQTYHVSAANFCKQHAVCPICADRSQTKRRAKFDNSIKYQAELVSEGSRFAYIVTYTVLDGPSISDSLTRLQTAKKNFRKMGQKREAGSRSTGEYSKVRAGIGTIEIKRGENSKLWHVHSHDLVFTDKPFDYSVYEGNQYSELKRKYKNNIPQVELSKIVKSTAEFQGKQVAISKMSGEWLIASGGESIGISVEKINHVPKHCSIKKKRFYKKLSLVDSITYQAKECLKYPVKPSDNSAIDAIEIISDTYNKRLVSSFGEFRKISVCDYNDDEKNQNPTFLVWSDKKKEYGQIYYGSIKESIEKSELSDIARKETGVVLGSYRRARRLVLNAKESYGQELSDKLNSIKSVFKAEINLIWTKYRNRIKWQTNIIANNYDNYNPLVALQGLWLQSSGSTDIYQSAFQ